MPREASQESHAEPEAADQRAEAAEHQPTHRLTESDAASADGQPADDSTVSRAEEMVDRVAARVAQWTSSFGRTLLRFGARAREEAEDMWAEAQHIRHGGRP